MSQDPGWFLNPGLRRQAPHLNKIYGTDANAKCNFVIVDYDQNWEVLAASCQSVRFTRDRGLSDLPLRNRLHCTTRVVIIEDICRETARQCIDYFELNPEMFENHFSGAQFPKPDDETVDYTSNDPEDWFTRHFKRDYISMRWLRPYKLCMAKDRTVTLGDRFVWADNGDPIRFTCNAWRPHVHFQTNGGTWSPMEGVSSGLDEDTVVASEERMTAWTGQRHGLQYAIILTDSGWNGERELQTKPEKEVVEVQKFETRPRGINTTALQLIQPEMSQSNSHQVGVISTRHVVTNSDVDEPPPINETRSPHSDVADSPAQLMIQGSNTALGVSSPLSTANSFLAICDSQAEVTSDTIARVSNTDEISQPPDDPEGRLNDSESRSSPIDTLPDKQFPFFGRLYAIKPMRNLTRRAPCADMSMRDAFRSGLLRTLTSTLEDLCMWMHRFSEHNTPNDHLGPWICIHNIICRDIEDTLRCIDVFLDDITGLADDELVLDHNISLWRHRLWFLGKQLRGFRSDLPLLTAFLWPRGDPGQTTPGTEAADKTTERISRLILESEARLQVTFNLLATSISVAEARRVIVEAEGVTRLTELAFVYIPLSFTASFFGMQVKELDPETTSIGGFFGLAVGVTLLSYTVRLVIRSEQMNRWRISFGKAIRDEHGIRENQGIKSRQVASFIAKRLWQPISARATPITIVYTLLLAPLIPMIAVWINSNLLGGIKIALTVNYIVFGGILAMILALFVKARRPAIAARVMS